MTLHSCACRVPLVKFRSRLFTALNLLPSMATQSPFKVPIRRQSSTNCAQVLRMAGPLSCLKSAMVLWLGTSLPVSPSQSRQASLAKPVYAAQIALYQAYMEASVPGISAAPAVFTAINKDTAEMHPELVPFDADLAQRMSDRAVRDPTGHRRGRVAAAHRDQPRLLRMPLLSVGRTLLGAAGMSDDNIIHFSPWQDFNDAPSIEDPFNVEPDPAPIETFLDVVFSKPRRTRICLTPPSRLV